MPIPRRAVITAIALTPLAACSPRPEQHTGGWDGPTFNSLEAMASTSSSIIAGRFTRFTVTDKVRIGTFGVSRFSQSVPGTIQVNMTGENGREDPRTTEIATATRGVEYLLFARRVTKSSRSDLQQYGDIYEIQGGANGILEVHDGQATPLGPGVPMTTASPGASAPRSFSVCDLMRLHTNR